MFENITFVDLKILSSFVKDYQKTYSIREITMRLKLNYSHAFKRINNLIKQKVLIKRKIGQVNHISLNILNIDTIQLMSFVEEIKSQKLDNLSLKLIVKEAILIDPLVCIGLFGSRVSGRITADSDWDIFIITQKRKKLEKIITKFPYLSNIQLQVFSVEEFQESILSTEETVVKQIIRNKQIIYNPHPFYNCIYNWEKIKHVSSQTN